MRAAAVDADQRDGAAGVLLHDLVRDAHERASDVVLVQDDALLVGIWTFLASRGRVKGLLALQPSSAVGRSPGNVNCGWVGRGEFRGVSLHRRCGCAIGARWRGGALTPYSCERSTCGCGADRGSAACADLRGVARAIDRGSPFTAGCRVARLGLAARDGGRAARGGPVASRRAVGDRARVEVTHHSALGHPGHPSTLRLPLPSCLDARWRGLVRSSPAQRPPPSRGAARAPQVALTPAARGATQQRSSTATRSTCTGQAAPGRRARRLPSTAPRTRPTASATSCSPPGWRTVRLTARSSAARDGRRAVQPAARASASGSVSTSVTAETGSSP